MIRIYQSILLISIILLTISGVQAQVKEASKMPVLNGRVTTVTGLPIPLLNITFESKDYLYRRNTSPDGRFMTTLPPGVYEMRIDEWKGKLPYNKEEFFPEYCQSYFRPFSRSNFQVESGDDLNLNVVLIESSCIDWDEERQDATFLRIYDIPNPPTPVQYETLFYGKPYSAKTFDLVIQYGIREEEKDSVRYGMIIGQQNGLLWGKPHPGVMLTYNLTTIYAAKVKYDKKQKTVYASGNVVVEDGKTISRLKEVVIKLEKTPSFEFKK